LTSTCWSSSAGATTNQAAPDAPASPPNQAIKDPARQISAGRAAETPQKRPGGHAQTTPLCTQPIAAHDLQQSTQIGGYLKSFLDNAW
jgi:hypothetical protein